MVIPTAGIRFKTQINAFEMVPEIPCQFLAKIIASPVVVKKSIRAFEYPPTS